MRGPATPPAPRRQPSPGYRTAKWGTVRRTSNTKPPSFPSQKQTIIFKRKYSRSTDRRGHNNYFPLTNFELILGLLCPPSKPGGKPHTPQQCGHLQPRERTLQRAEEAALSCVNPIARDGEAAAVSSPRSCAASLLLAHRFLGRNQQEWPKTVAERGWQRKGAEVGRRGDPPSPKPPAMLLSVLNTHGNPLASCWSYNLPRKSAKEKR